MSTLTKAAVSAAAIALLLSGCAGAPTPEGEVVVPSVGVSITRDGAIDQQIEEALRVNDFLPDWLNADQRFAIIEYSCAHLAADTSYDDTDRILSEFAQQSLGATTGKQVFDVGVVAGLGLTQYCPAQLPDVLK